MAGTRLTLGMVGSSTKENEKRVAIHPAHFGLIDAETRRSVYVEKGFGAPFRIPDERYAGQVAGLLTREELFERCDAIMCFKPTEGDFPYFREGQVLWGACHCVQNPGIVDAAIDKRMTLIAMEHMFLWHGEQRGEWLFHTQSELAGYCSVLHALSLLGIKGWHDQPRRCAVIGFGSTGRGAARALQALDFTDLTVFTGRPPVAVRFPDPTVKHGQYLRDPADRRRVLCRRDGGDPAPFGEELATYDIVVNGILQNTDDPMMFVWNDDLARFSTGTLIVDVSCDHGMGFEFARPTSFDEPLLEVGEGVVYYAVDHSPSYLFDTASVEHSKSCWPWVKDVVRGKDGWRACPTVGRAIDVEDGVVENRKILTFQGRAEEYPHARSQPCP